MRRTIVQAVAGATMIVALVAGCGSGDSNDSAGENGSASASSGAGASGTGTGASDGAGASAGAADASTGALSGDAAKVSDVITQATQAAPVSFTPESAELSDSAKQTLKTIADAMQGNDVKLTVSTSAGYPDAAKAKTLSEQRAQAIVAAFQEYGVAADRITTQATGTEKAQGDQALQTQIAVA